MSLGNECQWQIFYKKHPARHIIGRDEKANLVVLRDFLAVLAQGQWIPLWKLNPQPEQKVSAS